MPVNIDGAIAAVCGDIGIPPEIANALFIISRVPGIAAQAQEERAREHPMRQIDPKDHVYDGAAPAPPARQAPLMSVHRKAERQFDAVKLARNWGWNWPPIPSAERLSLAFCGPRLILPRLACTDSRDGCPKHLSAATDKGTGPMAKAVLVVEDDPSTLSGYVEYLTGAGFLATGSRTRRMPSRLPSTAPPAAVVTDITMPGMDGFALAKALHQDDADPARAGHRADRELVRRGQDPRGRRARCEPCCLKPCSPAHLVAELERVLLPVPCAKNRKARSRPAHRADDLQHATAVICAVWTDQAAPRPEHLSPTPPRQPGSPAPIGAS